jgi:hypothetical protein
LNESWLDRAYLTGVRSKKGVRQAKGEKKPVSVKPGVLTIDVMVFTDAPYSVDYGARIMFFSSASCLTEAVLVTPRKGL